MEAQNVQLAYNYYRTGEYEKAIVEFEKLFERNNNNRTYLDFLITSYQETEQFYKAETLIKQQQQKFPKQYYLKVKLGYNYQLQNNQEQADKLYQDAIGEVIKNPNTARLTGKAFQDAYMLDRAVSVYTTAMKKNPKLNFNLYLAKIYGEQLEITKMYNAYLDMVDANPSYYATIQRYVGAFINEDAENENNILFKQAVLKRLQDNPKDDWNNLLSWLYMQQKDYFKALIQEKAVYKRSNNGLLRIFELASIAFNDKDYDTANDAYNYILENSNNLVERIKAEEQLVKIAITNISSNEDKEKIKDKFNTLFETYGKSTTTIPLQLVQADFLTFQLNQPKEAIKILNQAEKYASSIYHKAEIKLKLADILVFTGKFNQALIYYTQVQTNVRSSEIAQRARLKVAKTSYYKGDFDWAKTQLRVLKSATSKLISNDALELNLLIGDNITNDSVRTALKLYAKADLLAFQNKNKQAIDTLSFLLKKFKGHPVEDEALFKQAQLYTKVKNYAFAENDYKKILALKEKGILVDDTLFALAELYQNKLDVPEKAKEAYKKIIFKYPSSIYLVDARKRYRKLRGDTPIE